MATVSSPDSVRDSTSARDSRDAVGTSLGEWLRQARESRGLTLDRIAHETKIPRRKLEALEHVNLATTRGGFYQRAELRAYARAVGLDQNLALARLQIALTSDEPGPDKAGPDKASPDKAGSVRHEEAAPRRPASARAFALAAAGLVIVTAAWFAYASREDTTALQGGAATDIAAGAGSNAGLPVQSTPAAAESPPLEPANPVSTETAETAASAVSTAELVVNTQPAGARVTVNGIGWGTSPVTIRFLTPGDKQIRVSKDGYVTEQRVLRVIEGRSQTLDIRLGSAPSP